MTEDRIYKRLNVASNILPSRLTTANTAFTSIPTNAVDMRVADKALAIVQIGTSTATPNATARIEYGSAAYNTAGAATAFSWTAYNTAATNTCGSNSEIGIEVSAVDMPATHPYLRLVVACDDMANNDALLVNATIITSGNRYKPTSGILDSVTTVD